VTLATEVLIINCCVRYYVDIDVQNIFKHSGVEKEYVVNSYGAGSTLNTEFIETHWQQNAE